MTPNQMKRGATFIHRRFMNADRTPLRCRITRIAQGVIYYRPDYGTHDDGTPWLGSPSYFPTTDFERYAIPEAR